MPTSINEKAMNAYIAEALEAQAPPGYRVEAEVTGSALAGGASPDFIQLHAPIYHRRAYYLYGASAANGGMGTFRSAQNAIMPASDAHIHRCGMNARGGDGNPNASSAPRAPEYAMNGSDSIAIALYPKAAETSPRISVCNARNVPHPGQ